MVYAHLCHRHPQQDTEGRPPEGSLDKRAPSPLPAPSCLQDRGQRLTDGEGAEAKRRGDSVQFIAGRWAAKEAVAKALGCGLGGRCAWRDIEVTGSASGAPVVTLSGDGARTMKENGIARVFVSISHERGHAVAMAVAEKNDIPS